MGDSKEVPRSIVLVIDYSGSQIPYIRTSIDAAKMLVDKLNPKDRMAVVTDDVRLLADFTSDKDELKARLETLRVSAIGGTPGASEQFDAILATVTELFSPEDIRPIVIFQTDGDQLDGLKGGQPLDPFQFPRKYSLEDIVTATEKSRATVYSVVSGVPFVGVPEAELIDRARRDWEKREAANIALLRARNLPVPESKPKMPGDEFLDTHARLWLRRQLAVEGIAKSTGAWAEFLEQPEQADEIYNRILTDIDRRYVLGYYPTNRARDGKRRKVHIEVRGHPEYSVWGQKSYFARDER
jgi:VWFA-related protein